jgi:Uma2 family endonuclease
MTAQRKLPEAPMTLDEFFVWDGGGHVGKLELIDGMVRAMAPASATHSFIQANITSALKVHLRGSPCRVGTEAPIIPPMARRINARAPDIAVTCAPITDSPVFEDPVLIVEVLSPSNEAETWESIHALAGLVSLKEILIVQSTAVYAEIYSRAADGAWPRDPVVVGEGGTIALASMGCELPMAEVYAGTHLAG